MKIRLASAIVAAGAATLCACSSDPAPSPGHATVRSSAAAVQVAPTKAVSRDACALVTAADIATATGIEVAPGTPVDSYLRGTSCEFLAGNEIVTVQTSPEPDAYLQEAKFEAMYDGVRKLDAAADRGFVAAPTSVGVGHLLVVKDGFGVDVSLASRSGYTVAQEQALATMIAGRI